MPITISPGQRGGQLLQLYRKQSYLTARGYSQEDKLPQDQDALVILFLSEDLMYWKGVFDHAGKSVQPVFPQTASALKPGQSFWLG